MSKNYLLKDEDAIMALKKGYKITRKKWKRGCYLILINDDLENVCISDETGYTYYLGSIIHGQNDWVLYDKPTLSAKIFLTKLKFRRS